MGFFAFQEKDPFLCVFFELFLIKKKNPGPFLSEGDSGVPWEGEGSVEGGEQKKKGKREEDGRKKFVRAKRREEGERERILGIFFFFSLLPFTSRKTPSPFLSSLSVSTLLKKEKEIKIKQQKERKTVKMGEDLKRNDASAVSLKQSSDDRKLSLAASPSKRVIIKSADMKDDMHKEAIDIAIAASENQSVKKKKKTL